MHAASTGAGPQAARPATVALLLGGLAMLGPMSVDAYLPAFGSIERTLQTGALQVQQTLTVYLFSFAVMSLWHGALSDAFGRRNVILVSLAVFAAATLGCAFAPDVQWLWAWRLLQGLSAGAGTVVGRAIVRDLYGGAPAARLLAMVGMLFALAPALAPVLGGWIVTHFGWRVIFAALFCYAAVLAFFCARHLPETLPAPDRLPLQARRLLHSYRDVLRSRAFLLGAGAGAFSFAGLFLFIAAAPAFVTRHLGLGAQSFGWQFMPIVGGLFLGSLLGGRLAGRLAPRALVKAGFALMLGGAVVSTAYHALAAPTLPWSVAPLFAYALGMSLAMPGLTLMVLDLFPATRGIVASCQSFSMTMLAALVAAVAAPALDGSVLALAAGQLLLAAAAFTLWRAADAAPASLAG